MKNWSVKKQVEQNSKIGFNLRALALQTACRFYEMLKLTILIPC